LSRLVSIEWSAADRKIVVPVYNKEKSTSGLFQCLGGTAKRVSFHCINMCIAITDRFFCLLVSAVECNATLLAPLCSCLLQRIRAYWKETPASARRKSCLHISSKHLHCAVKDTVI